MTVLEMRQSLGLSRREFAEKFHLTLRAVQSWEEGWRVPAKHTMFMMQRIVELETQLSAFQQV